MRSGVILWATANAKLDSIVSNAKGARKVCDAIAFVFLAILC